VDFRASRQGRLATRENNRVLPARHWRSLKLFSNAQASNNELVDLQFADAGATDCQTTHGYRTDCNCTEGDRAHRQSANCLG
jgi:hypothetical protein